MFQSFNHRKKLRRLMAARGSVCERCGVRVMVGKTAKGLSGYEVNEPLGEVRLNGEFVARIATIEHSVPRCSGGGGEDDNLKVYCLPCNRETNPKKR